MSDDGAVVLMCFFFVVFDFVSEVFLYFYVVFDLEVPVDYPSRDLVDCQSQVARLLYYPLLLCYFQCQNSCESPHCYFMCH